jgi:hypothetical protein
MPGIVAAGREFRGAVLAESDRMEYGTGVPSRLMS